MSKFYELNGTKLRLKSIAAVGKVQKVFDVENRREPAYGFLVWLQGNPEAWTLAYYATSGDNGQPTFEQLEEGAIAHATKQHEVLMEALEDALD